METYVAFSMLGVEAGLANKKLPNGSTAITVLKELYDLGVRLHVSKDHVFEVRMSVDTVGQRAELENAGIFPCVCRHRHLTRAIYNLLLKFSNRIHVQEPTAP